MRILFETLPVHPVTRQRVKKIKGDQSYNSFIVGLLDKYEFANVASEHRLDLRREK